MVYVYEKDIDAATRATIVQISNIIKVLAARHIPISDKVLDEAYRWLTENNYRPKNVLDEEVATSMADAMTVIYS